MYGFKLYQQIVTVEWNKKINWEQWLAGFVQFLQRVALQALYMLQRIPLSVRPSVLCQNQGTQKDAVFAIG